MAKVAEDTTSNFVDWNISLVNTTFSVNDGHDGLDFYAEVDAYWISKVNIVCWKKKPSTRFQFLLLYSRAFSSAKQPT